MTDPWFESAMEDSPMMAACKSGNIERIQFLCSLGRSRELFVKDAVGVTPFLRTCSLTTSLDLVHSQIVEYIISEEDFKFPVEEARYRCDCKCFIDDLTPLHFMVRANKFQLVKCFCQKYGAFEDISVTSIDGTSPLFTAILNGNLKMIQLFVEMYENISLFQSLVDYRSSNYMCWSAIHVACDAGELEIVKLLIECGCCLNKQDDKGRTPLLLSIHRYCSSDSQLAQSRYLGIVKLLLQSGTGSLFSNLDLRDFSRTNDLHPVSHAFKSDALLVIECLFPYINLDVLQKQFVLLISRFSRSFKVIRWISRKLYVTDVEKLNFFSLLIRNCELNFHADLVFFDFFIFGVFETPPRVLFNSYFKENDLVSEKRFPSWKHDDSIHHIHRCVIIENIFRFVELGWFHDTGGKVIVHRVNAYDRRIFDESFYRLFEPKIHFLLLLKKIFSKRNMSGLPGPPNFRGLSEKVSSIITHFIGCVDIGSISFLKSFFEFKTLEKSVTARFVKILSLFEDVKKLSDDLLLSSESIDLSIKTSKKKTAVELGR